MKGEFESKVCGIPCIVRVDSYFVQKPCVTADNPHDFYGYVELEYTILTTKGKEAPWLQNKMTEIDCDKMEEEIMEFMR